MTVYSSPGNLPAPEVGDDPNGPAQIKALSDRIAALWAGITTAQRDSLPAVDLWPGRRIWNLTTQRTEEYNGTTWRAVGSIDLDAHEAESDPHAWYVRKATLTTKGDLFVATGAGNVVRKAVGADRRVLTADSTQADGMAWTDIATIPLTAVNQTFQNYTLILSNAGQVVECTDPALTTVTVPPNSSVAFPIGTVIHVYAAAGSVAIAAGSGVTIRNRADLALYGECSLRKRATNEWVQVG